MAVTVRKIRVTIVAGALLLLVVVAGSIVYGRFAARRFWVELPHKLGADIRQETNGFTYSQSMKGRTVFTVHAAREVQHSNGKITLNDVTIALYSRNDGSVDRIHGSEFEFDQAAGVLTAAGDVYLDLAIPDTAVKNSPGGIPPQASPSAGANATSADLRVVHVKTSGLTFNQKAQTAVTAEPIEFQVGDASGRAVGARYDAGSGTLVLDSSVQGNDARGTTGNISRARSIEAGHAEFNRNSNLLQLDHAVYASGGQKIAADQTRVLLSKRGEPQRLDAAGHVHVVTNGGATIDGARLEAEMDVDGHPRDVHLSGGVEYAGISANAQKRSDALNRRGHAAEVRISLDTRGKPVLADLAGGVQVEEHSAEASRKLQAQTVRVTFADAAGGVRVLRAATAHGGAVVGLDLHANDGRTSSASQTEVRADDLVAQFEERLKKPQLTRVNGSGHTRLERRTAGGQDETSTGDTLAMTFLSTSAMSVRDEKTAGSGNANGFRIASAVQRGNVNVVRNLSADEQGHPAQIERASASEAAYDANSDQLRLAGQVQVDDRDGLLLADAATLDHASGDARAEGNVRLSYAQANGEILHVVADRAVEHRAEGTADFNGTRAKPARMWQTGLASAAQESGASPGQTGAQVEAAVLNIDRIHKLLVAHGDAGNDAGDAVHAVLAGPRTARTGAVRLTGGRMTYADQSRTLKVESGVRIEDRDGVMLARTATAYLTRNAEKGEPPARQTAALPGTKTIGPNQASPFPAGQVERVIARGDVSVDQPGRRATGDQLVYTAADGSFVMSGANGVQPRVVDDAHGSSTGASLRFRMGDDSVVISAGESTSEPARVRSETRAPASKIR